MKCRRNYVDEKGIRKIVWFGSCGAEVDKNGIYEDSSIANVSNVYPLSMFIERFIPQGNFNIKARDNFKGYIKVTSFYEDGSTDVEDLLYTIAADNEISITFHDDDIVSIKVESHHVQDPAILEFTYFTYPLKTIFFNNLDKHDNYSDEQQGVVDSLTQRLSVIKGELWYNVSYGVPLLDKVRSKGIMDAYIISIIVHHPDVVRVENFNSSISKHSYSCYADIISKYGTIQIKM